jgi:hypothetical protein
MTSRVYLPLLAGWLAAVSVSAAPAPAPAITDESKVPPYTLPDPLVTAAGSPVRDAAAWRAQRRPELLELFAREVYGRTPSGRPAALRAEVTSIDRHALDGKATRKEVTLWFTGKIDGPRMHLLIYQPNGLKSPPPVFLGLNFFGNHTVHADPAITLAQPQVVYDAARYRPADPQLQKKPPQRGAQADKWQVEAVLARGYATATVWCNDLAPDRADGLAAAGSVSEMLGTGGAEPRAGDAWGAMGVWAWGLSRALDYLETDPELDAPRVAVHGFSRLGKAAIWAAAQDERFAMLISNESGCGGAALSKRIYGETVGIINSKFPHWFAKNFRRYDDNEAALPVDQHELLALIAPRPLYVASAEGDQWADPRGEFLSAQGAAPVYALFGKKGLGVTAMPPLDTPVGDTIRYHNRTGKHDMTAYDWAQYLDFADRQWLR